MVSFPRTKTADRVILRQEEYLPPGFQINKFLYRLFPKIYFIGQENCVFNYNNYFFWILESVIEGIVLTILPLYIISHLSLNNEGISSDLWIVGMTT
jgi:hypothetical protein